MTRSKLLTVWLWTLALLPVVIVVAALVCALIGLTLPTPDQQLPTL